MSDEDNPIDPKRPRRTAPTPASPKTQMRAGNGRRLRPRNRRQLRRPKTLRSSPRSCLATATQTAMEKTWDYLHASPQQQATQRDASKLVEDVRAQRCQVWRDVERPAGDGSRYEARSRASQRNPEHTGRTSTGLEINIGDVSQPCAARSCERVCPDRPRLPNGIRSTSDSECCRNEPESIPLEIARQVAMAHSPQHIQLFHAERDVNTFFDLVPDAAKLQPQMIAAIERGEIQRTGNIIADMKRVYEHVRGKRQGSRKGRRSMESEMEETYRRINSR